MSPQKYKKHVKKFFLGFLPRVAFWVVIVELVVHSFVSSMIWAGAAPEIENRKGLSVSIFWIVTFVVFLLYYLQNIRIQQE